MRRTKTPGSAAPRLKCRCRRSRLRRGPGGEEGGNGNGGGGREGASAAQGHCGEEQKASLAPGTAERGPVIALYKLMRRGDACVALGVGRAGQP